MLNDVILGLYNPIRKRIFNIRIQTQYFLSKKKHSNTKVILTKENKNHYLYMENI